MVKAPKSSLVTPILRSLHWLKINERIEYKLLSLTYKVLTTSQPDYLHNLISVQSTGRTRSSSLVTLALHHLTCGINSLLHSANCPPGSPHPAHTTSQSPPSLSSPITASTFHPILKTHLFHILSSVVTLITSGLPLRILNLY